MFGIGTPELLVIFVVALIVLGPKRLPEVARALGKAMAELRKATSGLTDELSNARILIEDEVRNAQRPQHPTQPPAASVERGAAQPPPQAQTTDKPPAPEPAAVAAAPSADVPKPD